MEAERKKAEEEERKRRELEKAKQVGKYYLIILCLFLICFVLTTLLNNVQAARVGTGL